MWEPHLPRFLAEAGVTWTVVDDSHFKMVGLADQDLRGYYLSEEEGQAVGIFPSLKLLRYIIPWRDVDEVIETFRGWAEETPDGIAVMGDDGEKFGSWPETYRHCWGQDGWMDRFFAALEENSSWLITTPLGEYAARFPPRGRVYLPTASYEEMMAWALPAGPVAPVRAHQAPAGGRGPPGRGGPNARRLLAPLPGEVPRGQQPAQEDAARAPQGLSGPRAGRRTPRCWPTSGAASATAPTGTASSAAST